MGASSFSPSPMTTTPSMCTEPSRTRMASTAAWSAASLSPLPTRRADASAAASVTRTSSSARLRSGWVASSGVMALDGPRWLAWSLYRGGPRGRARKHQHGPQQGDEHADADVGQARGLPRLVDERQIDDEADGRDGADRRHLTARPRQSVTAVDDPGEDQRRERAGEQEPAGDRVDLPAGQRGGPLRVADRVVGVDLVPGEEKTNAQQEAADEGDDLRPGQPRVAHRADPTAKWWVTGFLRRRPPAPRHSRSCDRLRRRGAR